MRDHPCAGQEHTGLLSHPYPLVRAGGLFLLVVGSALVSGAIHWRWRVGLLAGGVAIATLVTTVATPTLVSGLARPSHSQLIALCAAVLLQALLIPLSLHATRNRDSSARWLTVFFVVGLHFLPMAVAFGPVVMVLGLAIMLNAGIGLWKPSEIDLRHSWLADGLLKVAAGIMMMLGVA